MNGDARKSFALLAAALFGLVGYWIGQLGETGPSTGHFIFVVWPFVMAVFFIAGFIILLIIATDK